MSIPMREIIKLKLHRPEFAPACDFLVLNSLTALQKKVFAWTGPDHDADFKLVARMLGISEDSAYKALKKLYDLKLLSRKCVFNNGYRRFVYRRA